MSRSTLAVVNCSGRWSASSSVEFVENPVLLLLLPPLPLMMVVLPTVAADEVVVVVLRGLVVLLAVTTTETTPAARAAIARIAFVIGQKGRWLEASWAKGPGCGGGGFPLFSERYSVTGTAINCPTTAMQHSANTLRIGMRQWRWQWRFKDSQDDRICVANIAENATQSHVRPSIRRNYSIRVTLLEWLIIYAWVYF